MKSLKALLVLLALGVMVSTPALAKNEKTTEQIARSVGGLNPGQAKRIDDILIKGQAALAALAPEDRRAKGGEIRQATMASVRRELTPAQQKAFDAIPPLTP